ncbi:MAG TPA: hypothetical protein VEN78_18515, partial [Bradyrhizobium sp.]|nr:hypothetical protein [Bradyrhizobium sp.]
QHSLYFLFSYFVLASDFLDQLRLSHLYCHFVSCKLIRATVRVFGIQPGNCACFDLHSLFRALGHTTRLRAESQNGGFPSRQGFGWFCGVGQAVGDLHE